MVTKFWKKEVLSVKSAYPATVLPEITALPMASSAPFATEE
jgi:hypothetical protein